MIAPPRFARCLLRRLVPPSDRALFIDDLEEAFANEVVRLGSAAARRWYWWQAITSIAPLLRHRLTTQAPAPNPSTTTHGDSMWRELIDDLRFAARLGTRNRLATTAVILTTVLGIGVTTAVFSVVNAVLLKPLPFEGSERVVQFGMTLRNGVYAPRMAYPDMQDYARDTRAFEAFAVATLDGMTLSGNDAPQQLLVARVDDGYARLFGVRPTLGRLFAPDEYRHDARVVVISNALWQQRFGGDTGVVGRSILLANEPYTVVGVLPPLAYAYPFPGIELLAPLAPAPGTYQANRGALWLRAVGKMRPGVSLEQARREVASVGDRLAREFPDANGGLAVRIEPLHDVEVGDVRAMLALLAAAVITVMLIACVNIANVLLGISHARGRELAVRAALGGSGGRIRRQLLTESTALATVGGVLGTALAPVVTRTLIAVYPGDLPRAIEVGVDWRVLGVAIAATLVAGLLTGLPAARRAGRLDLTRDLRVGARSSGTRGQRRMSRVLVTAQVALSVAVLFSAGLLLRTFRTLSTTDLGFVANGLTTFQVSASRARYPAREQVTSYFDAVDRELRAIAGVRDVAMASEVPLTTNGSLDVFVPKERGDQGQDNPQARYATVAPGYWQSLGVPLRSGRTFTRDDHERAPKVLVVNDVFASRVYPNDDPVGRVIEWGRMDWRIIGVVGSMRMRTPSEPPEPEVYVSTTQDLLRSRFVFVKSDLDAETLVPQLRRSLHAIDPTVAITEVASLDQHFADALAPQRFRASLFGVLGLLALFLSTLGIYGVIAYSVSRQIREIGVRIALGEEQGQVRRRVVLSATRIAMVGAALGAALALAASRWLAPFLVGTSPRDPAMLAAAALLLTTVAALAAYGPAHRASRVDPLVALRAD